MEALKVVVGALLIAAAGFFMNVVASWWKTPQNITRTRIAIATVGIITASAAAALIFTQDGGGVGDGGPQVVSTASASPQDDTADFNIDRPEIYSNVRYGFSLTYPETWRESESKNTDGAVLTSPDGVAEVRAYGSSLLDPSEMNGFPEPYRKYIIDKGGVLTSEGASQLYSVGEENGVPYRTQVDAWQFEYTVVDQDSKLPRKVLQQTAVDKGREFTVIASAPADRYEEYEDIFEKIVARAAMKQSCLSCTGN